MAVVMNHHVREHGELVIWYGLFPRINRGHGDEPEFSSKSTNWIGAKIKGLAGIIIVCVYVQSVNAKNLNSDLMKSLPVSA